MASIKEILQMDLSERANLYKASGIEKVVIDGNEFTDYKAFSFLWEKTYVKSPIRSGSGSIENLDSYATFLTPHLRIDFSLLSIDSYRSLMKLLYSKNEHTVTCYDVVYNKLTTNKMYFSTEEMPKLVALARELNGEEYVELLAIEGYVVEMVGTNSNLPTVQITYNLNPPLDVSWDSETTVSIEVPVNVSQPIGEDAIIVLGDEKTKISNINFNNKYKFKCWSETSNGLGFNYIDGDAYMVRGSTTLYAIWEMSA
jgi:hypothetical protein